MSVPLPPEAVEILRGRSFAHLVTLMPDGSPQVTPVWVDTDGQLVLVNTAEGRVKTRNMERDPRVAISICDPKDSYRYLSIRGRVVRMTREGAVDEIDRMSVRYEGKHYPNPEQPRISVAIEPLKVTLGE